MKSVKFNYNLMPSAKGLLSKHWSYGHVIHSKIFLKFFVYFFFLSGLVNEVEDETLARFETSYVNL